MTVHEENVTSVLGYISRCSLLCTSCTGSENWSYGPFNLNRKEVATINGP